MKHSRRLVTITVGVSLACGAVLGINEAQLQGPMRDIIERDPRNAGIDVSVRFGYYVDFDTLVFEIHDVSPGRSITDVTRVLFAFAEKLADRDFDRIELSQAGTVKFVMRGSDFKAIGRDYDVQNPVYLIRTLPEKLLRPDGTPAFGKWEGGLLGVLQKQMEDYRSFHERWYMRDLGRDIPDADENIHQPVDL